MTAARDPLARARGLVQTVAAVGEPLPIAELVRLLEMLGEDDPRLLATLGAAVDRARLTLGRVSVALEMYSTGEGQRR
ncbi:MAG TPA: hypothetical protein VNB06_05500 [Thermoanaerobaculia bacterium]|nr:hypothetical protein [Thermoanaerobaculia bacterium]